MWGWVVWGCEQECGGGRCGLGSVDVGVGSEGGGEGDYYFTFFFSFFDLFLFSSFCYFFLYLGSNFQPN